jgi:hypothetical protein
MDDDNKSAMSNDKASLRAVGAGCGVCILGGFVGAVIGYLLMPPPVEGGYYGALGQALKEVFLYCGGGLAVGLLTGALFASRIARWVDNDEAGKDPD